MFIAILTYKKPLSEVDKYLQAHRDYLAEHYSAGDFHRIRAAESTHRWCDNDKSHQPRGCQLLSRKTRSTSIASPTIK